MGSVEDGFGYPYGEWQQRKASLAAPSGSASDRPKCNDCGREMTPQNSTKHPELFLCDTCIAVQSACDSDKTAVAILKQDWLRLHRENQAMREEIDGLKAKLLVERIKGLTPNAPAQRPPATDV